MKATIRPLVNYYNRLDANDDNRRIIGNLLKIISELPHLTIQQAAEICGTSGATLTRLSKKAGYSGFNELRQQAGKTCENYHTENRFLSPDVLQNTLSATAYLETAMRLIASLKDVLTQPTLDVAVELLRKASHVLFVGASEDFVRLEQDLCVSGKFAEAHSFNVDTENAFDQLPADSVVIVEDPGYPWMNSGDAVVKAKTAGIPVLLITCSSDSKPNHSADLVIRLPGTKSAQDEVLFRSVLNILSLEYRKQVMDTWYYHA